MSTLQDVRQWKGPFGPNFWRVFGYLKPHLRLVWLIAFFTLFAIPLAFFEPYIVLYLVDYIVLDRQPELLADLAIKTFLFFLLYAIVQFLSAYCLLRLSQRLHNAIKSIQLDNLLAKGANFHRSTASGKLLFSFFNDSNQIGTLLSLGMINTISNLLLLVARGGVLWYINFWLFIIYIAIVPFQAAVILKVMKAVMRFEIALKKKDEELTALVESLLEGILVVKAFGFGNPLADTWKRLFASRLNLDFKNMIFQQVGSLIVNNIQLVGSFVVLFAGVYMIYGGTLSLGLLLAFLTVTGRITPGLQAIIGFFVAMQETLVGIERYYRIYDLPDERTEFSRREDKRDPASEKMLCGGGLRRIEVRQVVVDHGGGAAIHIPCDFQMERGKSYVWCGPNGSGKTSLALALAGIVPYGRGRITCDGVSLNDFCINSIRESILYLGNAPFWPERTLAENFCNANGSPELNQTRLEEALSVSAATDVLGSLPLGMDTVLSSDGHILSQGENQRLFLAMALYRRPDVLILDESLSHLPHAVSAHVTERLANLSSECIVVYITHDRSELEVFDDCVWFGGVAGRPSLSGWAL